MQDELEARFAQHYRGRHLPADALAWIDRPDARGPSGAAPVRWVFEQAVAELRASGMEQVAAALADAQAELMLVDHRAASEALLRAQLDLGRTAAVVAAGDAEG